MCLGNVIREKRKSKKNRMSDYSNRNFEIVDLSSVKTKSQRARSIEKRKMAFGRQHSERLVDHEANPTSEMVITATPRSTSPVEL